ncbi:MAG: penicillin-binding protein 1C [Cytophagaceae bacterium]
MGLLVFFILPSASFKEPTCTILEDKNGYLLGAKIATDGQWRFPDAEEVPQKFEKAIIAFEDKDFHKHLGVDFPALGAAMLSNLKAKRIVRGGSTLTMQTIRLARKNQKRTFLEKFIEIFSALKLDLLSSKNDILRMYISHAPFGGNVVGLEAASWRYFGRGANKLSWAESATLAVLPNAPSLIFPGKNQEKLLIKRNRLLLTMRDQGIIDSLTCQLALAEPVPGPPHPLPSIAPHLLDRAEKDGKKGQRIVTSLQTNLQERVQTMVQQHHERLRANGIHNAAVLVADVASGKVIAYCGNVGNLKTVRSPHVDIIHAPRSTGSILKPFLFSMIVNEGMLLPGALVPDIPTIIGGYAPKNYNLTYDGAVPMKNAISRSLNVPAVRLLQEYGIEKFHLNLKKMGMSTLKKPASHYGLSLILGGAEGTLWDLAGIYRNMAFTLNYYHTSYGKHPAYTPLSYTNDKVPILEQKSASPDAGAIFLTFEAMNEVNRPEEESNWKDFSSAYKIAWKTGTSFGHRDGWAIGCTPQYVVAVWAGNADGEGRPGLTGIDAAGPLLFDIFKLLKSPRWFTQPFNDMKETITCISSGFRASPNCPATDTLWSQKDSHYSPSCPYHEVVFLDHSLNYRVSSECESINNMQKRSWFVLPPIMEYYFKNKNVRYAPLPPFRPGCDHIQKTKVLDVIYPLPGSRIHIPVELDESLGNTVFEVAHINPEAKVYWYLNEEFLGTTLEHHQMAVQPTAGQHKLTVMDEKGVVKELNFEIILSGQDK